MARGPAYTNRPPQPPAGPCGLGEDHAEPTLAPTLAAVVVLDHPPALGRALHRPSGRQGGRGGRTERAGW